MVNPDSEWNNYLRKYKKEYKVKKQRDKTYEILCKSGNVYTYSIGKKLLAFYFNGVKHPKSRLFLGKSLKRLGIWHEVLQEGDFEIIICFKEEDLTRVEQIFHIKKKKKISLELKEKLAERLKQARLK